MKKTLTIILSLILSFIFLIGIVGCEGCIIEDRLPEYDGKFFRYAVRIEKGEKKGYLVGLTELGMEQTELILPQEIDGVPIVGIGYMRNNAFWDGPVGSLRSENLEKLYCPYSLDNWDSNSSLYSTYTANFTNCYIVRINYNGLSFGRSGDILSFPAYSLVVSSNSDYTILPMGKVLLANVSYMYNFENAENEGYYWVDSYDNSLITFIPPSPEREGYTFGGWYKESECINEWDFDVDKAGSELLIDVNTFMGENRKSAQYNEDNGIKLYAKWIKK